MSSPIHQRAREAAASVNSDLVQIAKIFPTPLASIVHPEAERLCRELTEVILAHEAADPGVSHSNQGGWQSQDDFLAWSGEAGAELVAFAIAFANRMSAVLDPAHGLVAADLDWAFNAWANVNRSGHGNVSHAHPGAYWSAVYWVDDGREPGEEDCGGELEFLDPRGSMPLMLAPSIKMRIEGCLLAGLRHQVSPKSGTLVLFPSWLLHQVAVFTGKRPRISIAINLVPPMAG
ncbi:hypothetical protein HT136_00835 [Novosphingobium profundi]|uniref:TIGR02466 family protein n=1 Tax=Novosphingobium profundi TaxID=1774954 RepID=UPI001BDAC4D8|nr:TIGR02466 family protein [Novosphingobium profundi]MBT0666914.1 hypothetical protein [Novosphingobium profundi]